jgi:hypothetical protein
LLKVVVRIKQDAINGPTTLDLRNYFGEIDRVCKFYDKNGTWDYLPDMVDGKLTISGGGAIVPPTVTTNAATNILKNSATLNGNLGNMGGDTHCKVWFQYGLTASYGTDTAKQDKTSTGLFFADIIGLTPDTTYHFRAVANNTAGRTNGTDLTFKTAAAQAPKPDLDVTGGPINWPKVKPSTTVQTNLTVTNIGDPGSKLNWQVNTSSIPTWGTTWTFNPPSGSDLSPGSGTTVHVSVVAPSNKTTTFTGTLKIENKDNHSDFVIIQVTLVTPRSHNLVTSLLAQFLERLFERFPRLEQILMSLPVFQHLMDL